MLGGNTVTTSHKCCLLEIGKAPQKAFLKLVLKNKNDHPISKFIMQRVFRKCCLLELGKAPQKAIFKTCLKNKNTTRFPNLQCNEFFSSAVGLSSEKLNKRRFLNLAFLKLK